MTHTIRAAVVLLLTTTSVGTAQRQPPAQDQGFSQYLFPPELIMQFQQKVNLQPEQRTAITQAIQQMQSKIVDLQWQMQAEVQKLNEIMQESTIKETEALAQVDRVLGIEREVKRTHLGMLIKIKNTLSTDQQTALDSLQQMWELKAPQASNEMGRATVTKTKSTSPSTKRP